MKYKVIMKLEYKERYIASKSTAAKILITQYTTKIFLGIIVRTTKHTVYKLTN